MRILITGGCGFIGSNLIYRILVNTDFQVLNVDKLTYAGTTRNHKDFLYNPNYRFEKADIQDIHKMKKLFSSFKPQAVIHLAAESHVDKSIESSSEFIDSNIIGTHALLEVARNYCKVFGDPDSFRFLAVSTDEVFGALDFDDPPFTEKSQYRPNSPYSASKAAADHMVRAWHKTYGLQTLITHCSNNYGKQQLPEKLIPKTIFRAYDRQPIPVYGDGSNVRDWIHVDDHNDALLAVLLKGKPGDVYNIGGDNEWSNIDLVNKICDIVDRLMGGKEKAGPPRRELITFVADRLGHDKRYAIDFSKIRNDLRWEPKIPFVGGLESTVAWYLSHRYWWL
jgi:dTDP-glucose 4,6-dehydratase